MIPSPEMVEQYRTANGGWRREDLGRWGVPWPPPHGWREQLKRKWDMAIAEFLEKQLAKTKG